MTDGRPTVHELFKRLKDAKEFVKNQHGLFANLSKVAGELNKSWRWGFR